MTRQEFLKISAILGIGMPLNALLLSCSDDDTTPSNIDSVIIIGAGAAGMSAGLLLQQRGINYQILEASSSYGGRMKKTDSFADFPIPLGAEWLETAESEFNRIVNDSSVDVDLNMISYAASDTNFYWNGNRLREDTLGSVPPDKKFFNATWFDFFEQYVLPNVQANIRFNTIVESIDYSGDQITVNIQGGESLTVDKVIFTAPLKQVQLGNITFSPSLPSSKQDAIDEAEIWDGIKVFIECREKFYPTFLEFDVSPNSAGERIYYDAAYGQNTTKNILALFCVGSPVAEYANKSDEELKQFILSELDQIFSGQGSTNYIKHTVQHWGSEPFVNGAYLRNNENWRRARTLGEPVSNKIYFAGEAYSDGEDWGSVHNAAQSASRAVNAMVG